MAQVLALRVKNRVQVLRTHKKMPGGCGSLSVISVLVGGDRDPQSKLESKTSHIVNSGLE